jgi:hypothetical protein
LEKTKMGNLTKGKTTKRAAVPRAKPATGAETSAAVAEAMRPSLAGVVVSALQAALTKAAVEVEAAPSGSAGTFGSDLLLTNVLRAKALAWRPVVAEQLVMTHDTHGRFFLRAVEFDEGFLVGVIGTDGATYCECELYDSRAEMDADWSEWLTTVTQ